MVGTTYVENQTGCNIMIWRSWLLLFHFQIGMWLLIMHLAFFWNQRITRRKWWIIYIYIMLFISKCNNWNMCYLGGCYTTMNVTATFHFPPIMHISGKRFLCCSIMKILWMFVISNKLIILSLLWSMIIIAVTWCFAGMPVMFCILSH